MNTTSRGCEWQPDKHVINSIYAALDAAILIGQIIVSIPIIAVIAIIVGIAGPFILIAAVLVVILELVWNAKVECARKSTMMDRR